MEQLTLSSKAQKYFLIFLTREPIASDVWQKLEDKYIAKSIKNYLYLKKKIFQFQQKSGASRSGHLNKFNKILGNL